MKKNDRQNRILEKDIQRTICDYLSVKDIFFWRSNNIPVFSQGRFRAMPKYSPKGLPDILCLHRGKFIGIEVKRPKAYTNPKQTKDQNDFKEKLEANGGFYYKVFSLEDVFRIKEIFVLNQFLLKTTPNIVDVS